MKLNEIEYPLRLCVELMHYGFWSCEKTKEKTVSELKEAMRFFFTDEQINEAGRILSGAAVKSINSPE